MHLTDFDYDLPPELIAQEPLEPRDAARLLVLDRCADAVSLAHRHVRDLPALLRPGDLLVANRSRVLPARVRGRLKGGGRAELLLLTRLGPGVWQTLARPARRLRLGDVVAISEHLSARIVAAEAGGVRQIEVDSAADDPDAALLAAGSVPLPPYIHGWRGDPERYQTIFAAEAGSAAAPTAGLHFTRELIDRLAQRGIGFTAITLHVGLDTFRPIDPEVAQPADHKMHREWFSVPPAAAQQIARTRASGGRIVAVGTTSVRTLETWASTGSSAGWTDLFILPGYQFRLVDALLTNFHLPRSTLLMLVSAFAGREPILAAYAAAAEARYRFFSFGDAMLIA